MCHDHTRSNCLSYANTHRPIREPPVAEFPTGRAAAWFGAATVFMAVSRVHNHVGLLVTISAMSLCGVVALVLLSRTSHRWRPKDLKRHWVPKMVGFMAAIAILGVPFSLYPGKALEFLTQAYLKTLLIGLIVWAVSRTSYGARFMAKVVACAGLATIFLALHVHGINTAGRLEAAYTYDPNDLALISLVTLPLVVWWITDRSTTYGKALVVTIPVILWVIVRTESRGGFLGLAALILGFLVISIKWAPPRARKVGRLLLLGLVLASPLIGGEYLSRMASITDEDDYNRTSPTGRLEIWKRGMGYALSNPFMGVGIDNFNTAEGRSELGQYRMSRGIGWKWSSAHNSYVQVAAELGIFAGVVFIVLVLRTTLTLTLWFRNRTPARGPPDLLPTFLGLSFVGFAVQGAFLSFAYYDVVYVLFGLASAVMLNAEARTDRVDRVRRGRPVRRHAPTSPVITT